ncbi:MAG: hypothetical protein ACJ8D4_25535 [Xanthobacteraceae bacterium]
MAESSKKERRGRIAPSPATTPPADPPSIPDPLGDDRHVVASGRLTGESPDHEGLLGSGAEPLPDGGVEQHPMHDEDLEDLGPDDYEALTDAPETGFLRRVDEEVALDIDESEVEDADLEEDVETPYKEQPG